MKKEIFFDDRALSQGKYFICEGQMNARNGQRYELGEWLGRGGNAAVYKCQQTISGEERAIKFLLRTNDRNKRRFAREIRLLSSINVDHITKYFGAGQVTATDNRTGRVHDLPFIVMELADHNLSQVMGEKPTPLEYFQYAGQFRGLASALASLHESAVHRDIKPENILVIGERWMLSDLGLCAYHDDQEDLTPAGQNVGPKFWLSPEANNRRLGGVDNIGTASDVFQMAAIFWFVATGRHPSGIVTEQDWTGPSKLFDLLHKSLYHDHTMRPRDGAEFLKELEEALVE